MASALRSLRRRISRMEKQGFIIPEWMKRITKEETAIKYASREAVAEKSKFKETYKGEQRIVSGLRGLEVLQAQATARRQETIKKKKKEKDDIWKWKDQIRAFDVIFYNYIVRFRSDDLASKFIEAYEKAKDTSPNFVVGLLELKSDFVEQLQTAMWIGPSDYEEMEVAYTKWTNLMADALGAEEGMKFREAIGQLEDESEGGYTIL